MSYEMQFQPQNSLQTPEHRQMGMFLHLSQLINLVIPPAGIVVPIVIWQTQKDKMPGLDRHGKMIVNFMLSSLIYFAISFVLMFFIIGIFGLIALGLIGIIFPIIGGIKANNGEFWEYPLTIKFLK